MAVRCSLSPPIITQKHSQLKKPVNGVLMIAHKHVSVHNTHLLQIKSSLKNKVFEDQSEGIVCYRDENGEIICEGYDEGPRLQQESTRINCSNPRDTQMVDLLQRSWLQIVDVAGAKDFKSNGFNTFF